MEEGDWEGLDLARGRILFLIYRKFLAQEKIDCTHCVESGVRGPHCRKYSPHGADVLLHAALVNEFLLDGQDFCAHLVSEDL